jgi:hypothetical protein
MHLEKAGRQHSRRPLLRAGLVFRVRDGTTTSSLTLPLRVKRKSMLFSPNVIHYSVQKIAHFIHYSGHHEASSILVMLKAFARCG